MIIGVAEPESGAAPAILLPADPDFRKGRDKAKKIGRIRWGAIIIAALFHAAILASFLLDWSFALTPPPAPPPPIPVALVTEVPRAPPPAPPSPPQPRHFYDLHSGADQETTAPPQAAEKGPEAAPKPEPEAAPSRAEALEPAPPKPAHPTPPKPKEAPHETAPKPGQQLALNIRPGEAQREGDPYLNALKIMIEQHRLYPTNAVGPLGLNLQGTAVYLVFLSPSGALQGTRLEHSSGSPVLDDAARRMIEQAAPFPPVPSNYPQSGIIVLTWTIPIYPLSR